MSLASCVNLTADPLLLSIAAQGSSLFIEQLWALPHNYS